MVDTIKADLLAKLGGLTKKDFTKRQAGKNSRGEKPAEIWEATGAGGAIYVLNKEQYKLVPDKK